MERSCDKLNIVWISLEDTSPRFGCIGDTLARTPHIDRLAAEGALFRNAFSTAGVCAPSRAAVITGMYQTSIGAMHMRTTHKNRYLPELPTPYYAVPPAHVKTFTEYLRADGYYCTNNEKTDYQFEPPISAWDECGPNAHWRNREPGQPFFAVFNPTFTHESGMWSREEEPLVTDPDRVVLPPYLPDTPKSRRALARHYDNIEKDDEYVGRILEQLEQDGLADNTVVMLWSDHGEGLPRAKRWTYDAGIHVPLIVRWPGKLQPGTVSDRLVSLVDLAPTVLSLAGIGAPAHLHGRSFLDQAEEPRTYVFAARDRYDESYDKVRAVRDNRYKYIRNDYPNHPYLQWISYSHQHPILQEMWRLHLEDRLEGPQTLMLQPRRPVEELYDCEEDPYEIRNLADDPAYKPILKRMRAALEEWITQYGDMGDIPEERMVRSMWPDGVQPVTAQPIMIPVNTRLIGREAMAEGSFSEPTLLMLQCATQGASIVYAIENELGEAPRWQLYTGPLRLGSGKTVVRAKAVRIGFKVSGDSVGTFYIEAEGVEG
jgi:arylsulfatase A-like enzyme